MTSTAVPKAGIIPIQSKLEDPAMPPAAPANEADPLRIKFNHETARIAWAELQRFFARGVVIQISTELDLIDTAVAFSQDRTAFVEAEMALGRIGPVEADQAQRWIKTDATLWAVVVSPWVLVQDDTTNADSETSTQPH